MARVYRINILEDQLKRLTTKVPDIRQSVIVSNDGFVVAAFPTTGTEYREEAVNSPQVAAMAATLVALGDQTLERLSKGGIKRLLIEGHEGAIIVYPINPQTALACLVADSAKMGLTLREIARSAEKLSDTL